MVETAFGKDTATGHWEFMGLVLDKPFKTFPDGFPPELMDSFLKAIGVEGALGNRAASGTAIIEELGEEHARTGYPIVYTSADPVFQIAAHEDVVPLATLYEWCEAAFELVIPAGLSRVIARPFVGEFPNYTRTYNRKDYALTPPRRTFLNDLADAGVVTLGIGKIPSIYAHVGIPQGISTKGNAHGIEETLKAMRESEAGFVFTNLVDFDMLYGHRRNPAGYAQCLQDFDAKLPEILAELGDDDLLLIAADHGNDPTYRGTDHTREYVPMIAYSPSMNGGVNIGTRATFADVGRTIVEFFGAGTEIDLGESFLRELGLAR
jgi:phosphopentomutase